MVSHEFWINQALVSFSKTSNSTRRCTILMLFEKATCACFIQIALKTILLPKLINILKTAVWLQWKACEIDILNQRVTKKGILFQFTEEYTFYTFSALIQYIFTTSINCLAVEIGNVKAGYCLARWMHISHPVNAYLIVAPIR